MQKIISYCTKLDMICTNDGFTKSSINWEFSMITLNLVILYKNITICLIKIEFCPINDDFSHITLKLVTFYKNITIYSNQIEFGLINSEFHQKECYWFYHKCIFIFYSLLLRKNIHYIFFIYAYGIYIGFWSIILSSLSAHDATQRL